MGDDVIREISHALAVAGKGGGVTVHAGSWVALLARLRAAEAAYSAAYSAACDAAEAVREVDRPLNGEATGDALDAMYPLIDVWREAKEADGDGGD